MLAFASGTRGAIVRFGAIVSGLTLLLALLAGEAGAQAACERPTLSVARGIKCQVALDGTGDLSMSESGLDHTTTNDHAHAINAVYLGLSGRIDIDVSDSVITTTGAAARAFSAVHRGSGGSGMPVVAVDIDISNVVASSTGIGIFVDLAPQPGRGSSSGEVVISVRDSSIASGRSGLHVQSEAPEKIDIDLTGVEIETTGATDHGLYANQTGGGDIEIDIQGGSIKTAGWLAYGLRVQQTGASDGEGGTKSGDILINLRDADIEAAGSAARGVHAFQSTTATGDIRIDARGGSIKHTNSGAPALYAYSRGVSGDVEVVLEDVEVVTGGVTDEGETTGYNAPGVNAYKRGTTSAPVEGDVAVVLNGGSLHAMDFYGVYARQRSSSGNISVALRGGAALSTGGTAANYGVIAYHQGAGDIAVSLDDASVSTTGRNAYGVWGYHASASGGVSISLNDAAIRTSGDGARGVYGYVRDASNEGSVFIAMTGGSIAAEGLGAAGLDGLHLGLGSVTVTTGEEAEIETPFAVGVRGRLTNDANAAGRLLVTHRGAVEARDVGLLAWAARRSGHTSGDGAEEADDAARTEPMIHVASSGDVTVGASVADAFIRNRAAGEDGALSAGEGAVLAAITAGDSDALDAALDALPASYGEDYGAAARSLLRRRADESTDAGTLGRRAAEAVMGALGAGVRAAVMDYDAIAGYVRRGDVDPVLAAIAEDDRTEEQQATLDRQALLSPAERAALEAVLTGGDLEAALGALPAAYADAWKDTLRAHAASYNAGDVRVDIAGGTITADGDGVHARYAVPHERNGGIAVSVAEGARVRGGVNGISVSGGGLGSGGSRKQSVSIDGEVRGGTGAGVHMRGGGTLTVGSTGRVGAASGVGILSDGAGDLTADVSGRVEGDIRNAGGELRLTAAAGSVITGTVHDPVGPFTVAGGIGRLLYANGAAVTVPEGGRLTGVEVEGGREALRGGGDLRVSVAGRVAGDLRAGGGLDVAISGAMTGDVRAGGDLTANVSGTVEGDLRGMGDLTAVVSGLVDGDMEGLGAGDHAVRVAAGGEVTGTVRLAASTVTADGAIGAARLDGGGLVAVGPTGVIRGVDGVAVRAGGAPLTVELTLAARRLASVLGGVIVNEGGETTLIVNGVKLHDGAEGATGAEVPNGARDARLRAGAGADGVFVLDEFIESHPPRAGIYEALPGLLLRLESGRGRRARRTAPGSPVRVRLSGGGGSRGAERSASGAEYDFDSFGAEAGLDVRFPWTPGLSGSVSIRHQRASADVSLPAGRGEIDLAGAGLGLGLSWRGAGGWYLRGDFSVMDYAADLSSKKWGKLRSGAGAVVRSLDVEAGRRVTPGEGFRLAPRTWLARSEVSSMDAFTDSVGARFSFVRGSRLAGGLGLLAETERAARGGTLRLRGAADLESVLSGAETIVEVSGERLRAEAGRTRVLLGVGARWRKGRFSMDGELNAAGLTSDDKTWGGRLALGWRF